MKKFAKLLLVLTILAVPWLSSIQTLAGEDETKVGFEVQSIFSSHQIDRNVGFYYLETTPGTEQTMDINVRSTQSKEDITLEMVVEDTITGSNGQIDYTTDPAKLGDTLVHPLTEIVTPVKNEVTLKPGEEQILKLTVTPPKSTYDGIKMGRVIIREKTDDTKTGIVEVFQYAFSIVLSESGRPFNDGTIVELGDVYPNVRNAKKVIEADLSNPEPKVIENLKVRSWITKKGESKKFKENNIDNFSFAPHSKVAFPISWGMGEFEPGEYTFYWKAENKATSISLERNFTITTDQSKDLNNQTAFSVVTPTTFIILIVANVIISLLFMLYIISRNKNWLKEVKSKKEED